MTSDQPVGVRAGFWRRWLALWIDGIIISLPFQVVVAILFAATSGRIQQGVDGISAGMGLTYCSKRQAVPDGLAPPPPAGSNFARECNVYFFGAQTARTLQVGRDTKEGAITKTVSRYYMLDRHGRPIDGVSADGIVTMAFIAYLFAMEARTGASLGDRAMRIRVVDAAVPAAPSVPLRKIVTRYLAASVGFLPMLAVALAYLSLAYYMGQIWRKFPPAVSSHGSGSPGLRHSAGSFFSLFRSSGNAIHSTTELPEPLSCVSR